MQYFCDYFLLYLTGSSNMPLHSLHQAMTSMHCSHQLVPAHHSPAPALSGKVSPQLREKPKDSKLLKPLFRRLTAPLSRRRTRAVREARKTKRRPPGCEVEQSANRRYDRMKSKRAHKIAVFTFEWGCLCSRWRETGGDEEEGEEDAAAELASEIRGPEVQIAARHRGLKVCFEKKRRFWRNTFGALSTTMHTFLFFLQCFPCFEPNLSYPKSTHLLQHQKKSNNPLKQPFHL